LNIIIKNAQTEMGFVFHCWFWVLLFLLVTSFFIVTLPIFVLSLMCVYGPYHTRGTTEVLIIKLHKRLLTLENKTVSFYFQNTFFTHFKRLAGCFLLPFAATILFIYFCDAKDVSEHMTEAKSCKEWFQTMQVAKKSLLKLLRHSQIIFQAKLIDADF